VIDKVGERPPNSGKWRLGKIVGKIQPDIPDRENLIGSEMLKRSRSLAVAFFDFRSFTKILLKANQLSVRC
jgi:hypothetical protein